ncbi:flagellar basal body-associated FliL family protein [Asaia spathodeae]|uniref:flagellar basal body-associated FliL family protein n=1 Tax=Asaia spathodeae TaxID=657016 RepID=UPI002FC30328
MSESQFDDALDINPVDDDRLGKVAHPKKRRFAIIAAILAIGLLGGSTYLGIQKGWIFGQNKSASSTTASTAPQRTTFLTIPAVISSLDNGDSRPVYVKMATKLEIEGKESEASLKRFIPEIQDIFQTYLHETRPQEIRGNGIYRLRETLLRRLRVQVAPLKVTNFYITEFLIQ